MGKRTWAGRKSPVRCQHCGKRQPWKWAAWTWYLLGTSGGVTAQLAASEVPWAFRILVVPAIVTLVFGAVALAYDPSWVRALRRRAKRRGHCRGQL